MTITRAHLEDPSVTRWYHCVTRGARRAFLLGEGALNRRERTEHRLQKLAQIFSVAVAGSRSRITAMRQGASAGTGLR